MRLVKSLCAKIVEKLWFRLVCAWRARMTLTLYAEERHGMLERFSRNENEAEDHGTKMPQRSLVSTGG